MSELPDARRMLEEAERAAGAGDFALADERLRGAARIQEAELGPLHPDLANTLNNLAVVAEQTGRLGDAETFYRRAVAITSAALPPDDPMVAASRANLEDFCFARGLPVAMTPAAAPEPKPIVKPTPEPKPIATPAAPAPPLPARVVDRRPPPTPVAAPRPAETLPPTSRSFAWVGIAIIVLAAAALFMTRPWSSSREKAAPASTPTPAPQPAAVAAPTPAPPPAEQPPPVRAEPVPQAAPAVEPTRPPAVIPQSAPRAAAADKPPAPVSSGSVTLATAQLCQTFSASGANWQCDPASATVAPGRIVLYTRVRSAGDTTIMHRWYHDGALQQSKSLTITANQTEGYRTYSRQSVDAGDWRVEVRNEKGDLLHEQRFAVR